MKYLNINKIGIIALALALALGQVARLQLGNIAITALDIIVGCLGVYSIAKYLLSKPDFRFNQTARYVMGFFLCGVVGLVLFLRNMTGIELSISFLYAVRLALYLSLYFWVRGFDPKERKLAVISLSTAGVFMLLAGFLQYTYYPYLRNLYYLGWDDHLYRMFSVFLDPNFAGAFFVLFLLFMIDLLRSAKQRLIQVLYGAVALASIVAIFLTHSRTGLIMLIVAAAVYLLSFSTRKVTLIALVIFSLLLIITSNTKIEGLNPFRTASSEARVDSARNALKIIEVYPLFGVGFNSYRYAQEKMGFREEAPLYPSHADAGTDNSYLFVLATTGIAGGIFFVLVLVRLLRLLQKEARENHFPARSLFAGLIAVLVGSLFLNIIFYPMILVWLVVCAGIISSHNSKKAPWGYE